MTVPRLNNLPESVVELLMMCLVDTAYDCEEAAELFRSHFEGQLAKDFTANVVRGILREMAHDGMLQFFHAACTPAKQFEPPLQSAKCAPPNELHESPPLPEPVLETGPCLADMMLATIFEHLGRGESIQAMRACKSLHSAGRAAKHFARKVVFVQEGSASSDACLDRRLFNFMQNHGNEVQEMALRNTAVAPFWKQAGESLLKATDLHRCFTGTFEVLQHLILHSFKSQELKAILGDGRSFPQLQRLDCFQCCLSAANFNDLAQLPALSSLGIWGLKNTQISLPSTLPSFRLRELHLDPVEATTWPWLGGISHLHLCTSRPRLALASLPTTLQVLSLGSSVQDVSNPFVEAFVLLDEHVKSLLASLPLLTDLVLSGHVRLCPPSISALAERSLVRLSLARCSGLDCEEAFQSFATSSWPTLESFEVPGSSFRAADLAQIFPQLEVLTDTRSLVPQAGLSLAGKEAIWWEEVLDSRRPSVGFASCQAHRAPKINSPLGSLAQISHFLLRPGDFGEVCRGP